MLACHGQAPHFGAYKQSVSLMEKRGGDWGHGRGVTFDKAEKSYSTSMRLNCATPFIDADLRSVAERNRRVVPKRELSCK